MMSKKKIYDNNCWVNKDSLFKNFLKTPENNEAYLDYQDSPSSLNYTILNSKFKEFLNYIVLLSLIKTNITYEALHFKQHSSKIKEEQENTDYLTYKIYENEQKQDISESVFNDTWEFLLEDENLIEALNKLTKKQQIIIKLIFIKDKKIKDIANEIGVSQQAVSKVKKQALKKLKRIIEN